MNAPATQREGLPVGTQERLLQIISPRSTENPWPKKAVRVRNQLFIHMLLHLGFRRNELLALRMEEIDLPGNKVLISASLKTLGQGSQFSRVIVPLFKSRILDRTLVYTAIARAQHQVVIIGDRLAFEQSVVDPPNPSRRQTAMKHYLTAFEKKGQRSLGEPH